MNLGAPLISAPELAEPNSLWSIDMKWHDGSVFSAVYTAEQAKEIARRIIEFYGKPISDMGVSNVPAENLSSHRW